MLIITRTVTTNAALENVWNIWQDVTKWNTWDFSTDYCSLNGPFKEGTTGKWKSKNGPLLPIILIRVEPLKMFVIEYKLFLAQLVSSCYINTSEGKTHITQCYEIKGPLSFLYVYHIRSMMKKKFSLAMDAMIKRAESFNASH